MVEQATAVTTGSDDAVAAWTPPTLAPDPAVMTTDQFKHPTAQQLKEWEQAPKIDMFEEPTMKPLSLAPDLEATAKKESDAARSFGSVEAGPSSSAHIGDMFSWKPPDSAADDLSVMEDTSSVSKAVVDDAPEPKAQV